MEIVSKPTEHELKDYTFQFLGGDTFIISIDITAGDEVMETDTHYIFDTVAKPTLSDPDVTLDSEHIEIPKRHITVFGTRTRKQRMRSEEELLELRASIKRASKLIQ